MALISHHGAVIWMVGHVLVILSAIVAEVPDLPPLRLSSLDPAETDAELMDVLADESR